MIKHFLNVLKSKSRSIRLNIFISFFAKGVGVLSSFITVPFLISYLDHTRYGVWLTLTSVLQWITMFDFGLGNGFRNKFVAAKAQENHQLASEYLSTSYFVVSILSFLIILFFIVAFFIVDVSGIFNTTRSLSREINISLLILGCLQAVKFSIDLINYLLISDQRVGVSNLISAVSSVLIPIGYFGLAQFYVLDLINLSVVHMMIPIVILVIVSIYLFRKTYSIYRPLVRNIRFDRIKGIFDLGLKFFLIQISALILFTSDSVIISNLFGPEEVIPYNIAFKYFSIANFTFTIIITPLWAAFTREYELGNFDWIKRTLRKVVFIWAGLSLVAVMMLFLSAPFYHLWIGDKVEVPFVLSLGMMTFVIISNWNNIFAFFLNGTSKIKLQLIFSILIGVVNIPLSIFLARDCGLGPVGVIFATSICLSVCSILQPIQTMRIIQGTAKGIWNA